MSSITLVRRDINCKAQKVGNVMNMEFGLVPDLLVKVRKIVTINIK